MRFLPWILALAAAITPPASAQVAVPRHPAAEPDSARANGAANKDATRGAAQLTAPDVDAWLDGFMPYALATGDIAGAVIVVVKDGKILTKRGFGYSDVKARKGVDPETTLFRPGSISKLFTWTAVMQQVQAGKIDLDRDINDYLDFKIPPKFGKPITMRNLMTHTAGFAETAKYLVVFDANRSKPLGDVLKRAIPKRIYAPGAMPAYSNYGASLAGYIVERVSHEPFEQYVQRHIFAPLDMTRSSFAQPLPPALATLMARGYEQASKAPGGFEIIEMAPAGSLSSTGADMAKFMIAHLNAGAPLLDPATTAMMHAPANDPIPGLPPMALGFYHEDRNGQNIIGHAGDLNYFHSDLHLFPDHNVGIYVSVNSLGKEGSAHVVRENFFAAFTDRYFPAAARHLPTLGTAEEHGQALVGNYVSSRAVGFNFLRLAALASNAQVVLNDDKTITVSSLRNPAGVPIRWREVAPWRWQQVGGEDRLGAVVKDGRVTYMASAATAAIIGFIPAPAGLNSAWIFPAMGLTLAVTLLAALAWPVVALLRRNYGFKPATPGHSLLLQRAPKVTAWFLLAVTLGWLMIVQTLSTDVEAFDGRLDGWMRLLQGLTVVACVGAAASLWNALLTARSPKATRKVKFWTILCAASAVFLCWLAIDLGLLTPTLNY